MKVVVTDRKFPHREDPYGDVVSAAGGALSYHDFSSEDEVIAGCRDADVVLTFKAPLSARVIRELDATEAVIRIGTGVDTINVQAATAAGIAVSNAPGYSTQEVATHAITLMLAAAREVPLADRAMRESEGWGERNPINRMYGGTFGIVGLGRIGRAAVPKARGLDMDLVAHDPYVASDVFDLLGVEKVTFSELLDRADCVSVHAPLTAETRRLFSADEFDRMRRSAVLVNTARGPIVDEAALVEAVTAGDIWAAGLDVFETEPPNDTPALGCERIVCSPHHAGRCAESEAAGVEAVRDELARALGDDHLEHMINPEVRAYSDRLLNPER